MIAPRIPAATAATPTLIGRAVWRTSTLRALRAFGDGEAGGDREPVGVGVVSVLHHARLERQGQVLAELLDEARDRDRGPGDDAELDGLGRVLGAVEVQRRADAVGELADAVLERGAGRGHELRVALDAVQRRDEADVQHPLAGVL